MLHFIVSLDTPFFYDFFNEINLFSGRYSGQAIMHRMRKAIVISFNRFKVIANVCLLAHLFTTLYKQSPVFNQFWHQLAH